MTYEEIQEKLQKATEAIGKVENTITKQQARIEKDFTSYT